MNSQVGNRKNKRLTKEYPNEQHHKIKQSNICRREISLRKNRGSPIKTRMGNQVGISDEKSTTTSKNAETEHENIFGQSRKTRRLEETKQKILTKGAKLKRYRDRTE